MPQASCKLRRLASIKQPSSPSLQTYVMPRQIRRRMQKISSCFACRIPATLLLTARLPAGAHAFSTLQGCCTFLPAVSRTHNLKCIQHKLVQFSGIRRIGLAYNVRHVAILLMRAVHWPGAHPCHQRGSLLLRAHTPEQRNTGDAQPSDNFASAPASPAPPSGGQNHSSTGAAADRSGEHAQLAADLQAQWQHACAQLSSLPGHQRHVQQLQVPRVTLQELQPAQPSSQRLQECLQQAESVSTVLQIALHAPDLHFTKTQTLLARSDHTLADVKDAIKCSNDEYAHDEMGHALCGGLFYFGAKLYADSRSAGQPGHVDYVQNIAAFLESNAKGMQHNVRAAFARKGLQEATPNLAEAEPSVLSMQDTRLRDLGVRVNQAGSMLYLHAGACEHVVVFEDVRLQHSGDAPAALCEPVTLPSQRRRLEKCCICNVRPAVKMTFDDVLAPESPAFFCEKCFDDLHCDENGRLSSEARGADVYEMY